MSSPIDSLTLNVTHKGTRYNLSILPSETWAILQERLHELTHVPPAFQKLLYKGKKATVGHDDTVEQAGIKDGMKIVLLGSTEQEIGGIKAVEAEKKRREEIMRQRVAKGPTKVRLSQFMLKPLLKPP